MKAFELLDKPEKWIQNAYCRDRDGLNYITGRSPRATCWCVIGALDKCYAGEGWEEPFVKLKLAVGDIVKWNDAPERTYEEVIELLKKLDI